MKLSVTEDINGQKYVRMSDEKRNVTMTNQEAIKILDEYKHCFWDKLYEPICMAIKALEQEPCDKYIKEIDHLRKYISKLETQIVEQEPKYCDRNICIKNEYNGIGCNECEVTKSQEPKTGHWIAIDEEPHEDYECDRCGYMCSTFTANIKPHTEYKFCPNCGARMIEQKESEE